MLARGLGMSHNAWHNGSASAANASLAIPLPHLSTFCFQLVAREFGEAPLVAAALDARVLQDGCDTFRIYSNVSWLHGVSDHQGCSSCVEQAFYGSLDFPKGGEYGTRLNTGAFIYVWRHIFATRVWESCEWTIKLDADIMMRPDRLRNYLALFIPTSPFYGKNVGDAMHGGIEVLTHPAVATYAAHQSTCESLAWADKGEDWYLSLCMDALNVSGQRMGLLMREGENGGGTTCSGCDVSYHEFSDAEAWETCRQETLQSRPAVYFPGGYFCTTWTWWQLTVAVLGILAATCCLIRLFAPLRQYCRNARSSRGERLPLFPKR